MASIGNLAATISLNPAGFTAGVKEVNRGLNIIVSDANKAAIALTRTERAMNIRNAGGRGGNAFQSIGFGLDDFVQQTQAAGLQAGIRAAGNNITMLASAFGPLAIVAAAAGVALANDFAGSLRSTDSAVEQFADNLGGLKAALNSIQCRRELNVKINGLDTRDEAQQLARSAGDRVSMLKEQKARAIAR